MPGRISTQYESIRLSLSDQNSDLTHMKLAISVSTPGTISSAMMMKKKNCAPGNLNRANAYAARQATSSTPTTLAKVTSSEFFTYGATTSHALE